METNKESDLQIVNKERQRQWEIDIELHERCITWTERIREGLGEGVKK